MSVKQSGSHEILTTDHLTEDTVALLNGKYKDGKAKKIGIEVEMPFVKKEDLKPIAFKGKKSISAVFNKLCKKKSGWQPDSTENGHVTSLKSESGFVTLEPGGQIEFSSAARNTLSELSADIGQYFDDCKDVSKKLGIDVVPYGFHPHLTIDECPYISERTRFSALKPVFEAEGGYSAWGQSCSVQVTLDSPGLDEAFGAFKLGLILQPLAAAMFANSPFAKGEDSGFKSWRRQSLQALDSPLYTVPENLFDDDYTITDWAKHVLGVPMSFIVREDQYIAVAPKPFIDMVGKPLPELAHLPEDQQYLTKTDLLDHLTGIKPEMLLKPNLLLEFRAADLGPSPDNWMAVGAFWTGLYYDKEAYQAAKDYVAEWTTEERSSFRKNAAKDGLQTAVAGKTAQQVALDIIEIARQGLSRIEPEAVQLLDTLSKQVTLGITPADMALEKFAKNGGNIDDTLKQSFLFAPEKKKDTLSSGKIENKGGAAGQKPRH
jgi:glutamate--cysteine ligase